MADPSTTVTVLNGGEAQPFIDAYSNAGGVLDYVRVVVRHGDVEMRHRLAAVAALEEVARRYEMAMHIDAQAATAVSVDVQTFVGRSYDWSTMKIVDELFTSKVFPLKLPAFSNGDYISDGYAEAFAYTPYHVQASGEQINRWFATINQELFGGLDDQLEIRSWSTDWSNYFDAGKEWWGAFLWTVWRPGLPWLVAIGASSTD